MKEVYSDSVYESSMTERLEQSRQKLQELLDVWNSLELKVCDSSGELHEMLFHPQAIVKEGINRKENDSQGLSKEEILKYKAGLSFRNANPFYEKAREVRQDAYSNRVTDLFSIKDNQVIIMAEAAKELIKAKSIYANGPRQEKVAGEILQLGKLVNSINDSCYGSLNLDNLFTPNLRADSENAPKRIDHDEFKRLLKTV